MLHFGSTPKPLKVLSAAEVKQDHGLGYDNSPVSVTDTYTNSPSRFT